MAKKSDNDPKKSTLARIKRTEAYAERVRALFAATVNEILALNKTMPTLNEGEMFSFDNESLKKQREVERLLRQLHSVATMAIEKGIRLEWAQANAECDKLVQSCFGKRALETPEFTAWTQRNEAAQAAFISRSERGLNLSQRVWKSCRQLRDEMEVAITVAVGDGTSAASMSRSVRKYLNDPDLMFRRFRYKAGEEIEYDEDGNEIGKKIVWGKKWKKRIKKPDGTVGWIDYDKDSYRDEWTGPGYYKSSAQNAMRVARTETNIAYRRADNERWQQMDFVLGQRVQLSRNHPKKDICDKLAGDYPPDFVFDGWHPQCFCFVTPILMDESEIKKMNEAMLRGEKYTPRGKRITQYPENFKQWVRDNEERIVAAHDVGTDPYFVRNNFGAVQDILNPKKQLAPQEIAQQRHEARTPEQEEKIRLAWQERKDRIEAEKRAAEAERIRIERINNAAHNVLNVANNRFADFDIDTVALDTAIQSGDTTLINAETRALAKKLSEKQKQVKTTASNVLGVASKYKDFAGDADVSSLSDVMKTANVSAINAQTRALAQRVKTIKQKLKTMSDVLYNVDNWAQQHTVAKLEKAHKAVKDMYAKHAGKSLKDLRASLAFEAGWKKDHPKYSTDKVVQEAYEQRVKELDEEIKWQEIKQAYKDYQTKFATIFPTLLQELTDAITAKDFATAQAAVTRLQPWDKVITERTRLSTVLGASNAGLLKEVDDAIRAKDVTAATAALNKLDKLKDIIAQRGALVTSIGTEYSSLFTELDDAISKNKPIVAKKAVTTLERWAKVIEQLKKAEVATQTDELKKYIAELKKAISSKKITDAEAIAAKMKSLTMSAIEIYCDKHYTEEFTVKSQDTYDNVMQNLGKVTKDAWQNATEEQRAAFPYYTDSSAHSQRILTNVGLGRPEPYADKLDAILDKIQTNQDMVLRSGQNYDVAMYVFGVEFMKLLQAGQLDELNNRFAGTIGVNKAYMSTSFNRLGGFTKQFEFHIFAPKGTHCMNLNELSVFGNGLGIKWDGESYDPIWSSGGETEIFLHRNIMYKFIRAEAGTGKRGTTRVYIQLVGRL